MPDVIFRNVIIIDDHHITDHGFIVVYTKWLTLIAVNIGLGKRAYRVGNKLFLIFGYIQGKCLQEVIFIDRL